MREIQPIAGACVWHGSEIAHSARWLRRLTAAQLAEIDAALRAVRARGLGWEEIGAADFPLPAFAALADDIRGELEEGSGIVLLRGIAPGRYAPDDLKLLYAGLCRQIGTTVYSNRAGEVMREIRDVTRDAVSHGERSVGERYGALPEAGQPGAFLSSYARTLTNRELRFHTDRCDVVALFCIRQALKGGVSKLCSSPAVHNAMLQRRPDLAGALYDDVWRSRFGEEDATDQSSYPLPVWGVEGGKFTSHYSRTFVEAAQRRPAAEVPRLSPAQEAALDMLHELAEELAFEMTFAPGDIQFVNNHVIYHARTAFEDDAAQGADRLLLRLWLAVPNSRALPEGHEILWRSTEAGALRGGIGQTSAPVG
jgi:alpha-ketoglutarate-dependent taurine dioxygenase